MIDINTYIIEKLKIDKNSSVKKNNDLPLYQRYSKGDRCLVINESGLQNQTKIRIEVIEIQRVTKTLVNAIVITNVTGYYFNAFKYKDNKSNNYISNSGTTSSWMIVTSEDSLDILEMIKKNNYKLDFYSILWKSGRRMEPDLIPVVEKIEGTDGSSFKDYKPITPEKFKELEDAL